MCFSKIIDTGSKPSFPRRLILQSDNDLVQVYWEMQSALLRNIILTRIKRHQCIIDLRCEFLYHATCLYVFVVFKVWVEMCCVPQIPLENKSIFSGSLFQYLEENKKWRNRFFFIPDSYNINFYDNKVVSGKYSLFYRIQVWFTARCVNSAPRSYLPVPWQRPHSQRNHQLCWLQSADIHGAVPGPDQQQPAWWGGGWGGGRWESETVAATCW